MLAYIEIPGELLQHGAGTHSRVSGLMDRPRSKWSTSVLSSLLQRDGDSHAVEYQDHTLRKPRVGVAGKSLWGE